METKKLSDVNTVASVADNDFLAVILSSGEIAKIKKKDFWNVLKDNLLSDGKSKDTDNFSGLPISNFLNKEAANDPNANQQRNFMGYFYGDTNGGMRGFTGPAVTINPTGKSAIQYHADAASGRIAMRVCSLEGIWTPWKEITTASL